ncbi:hypothetical protein ciss_07710 [Carboxydothermus islandicus]|uniref:ATP-binding protein n=1 Tax=Carboxydothermus islandicus TaxID=661089 RepID=A0A1L8D101_9THEO|nr:BREX system ATP-binding domain-containing protein [Carboxydothermus islandicus]GAV24838.1 hypothetical protein ciss_07710 [Carboxydothermus islandicus]
MLGKTVFSDEYGYGKVIGTRFMQDELYIEFNQPKLKRWLKRNKVKIIEDSSLIPEKKEKIESVPLSEELKARMSLESLRLGNVPLYHAEQIIVGRKHEIDTLKYFLKSDSQNVIYLVGNYGSGKTHFLKWLNEVALENYFATALIELDNIEVPPNNSYKIYKKILESLKVKKGNVHYDFIDLLNFLIKNIKENKLDYYGNNRILYSFFSYIKTFDNINIYEVLEWWLGYSKLPKMKSKIPTVQTATNVHINLLTFLSDYLTSYLGFNGLLILIDEAEFIENTLLNLRRMTLAKNFIKALTLTCKNSIISNEGYTDNDQNMTIGKKSGLIYGANYTDIPYIHKSPNYLKAVIAFTPIEFADELIDDFSLDVIELNDLSKDDYKILTRNIINLYNLGYKLNINAEDFIEENFEFIFQKSNNSTRLFSKFVIEKLDLYNYQLFKEGKIKF